MTSQYLDKQSKNIYLWLWHNYRPIYPTITIITVKLAWWYTYTRSYRPFWKLSKSSIWKRRFYEKRQNLQSPNVPDDSQEPVSSINISALTAMRILLKKYPYHTVLKHGYVSLDRRVSLTHPSLDSMPDISQSIFSGTFSWMQKFVFWQKFHWSLFTKVQLTISRHWFR